MILPSILSTSHLRLYEKLEPLRGVAPMIHVDIEDGDFVPNLSFGPKMIKEISEEFGFGLDIHYMVRDPQRYMDIFADIPHAWISYHAETGILPEDLDLPKGALVGAAVNPDTKTLGQEYLSSIDFLVVMGVYPGFGGAKFEQATYGNVKNYAEIRKDNGYGFDILVDGGVSKSNILALKSCGADNFVAGAGVFSENPRESYLELKRMCDCYDGD